MTQTQRKRVDLDDNVDRMSLIWDILGLLSYSVLFVIWEAFLCFRGLNSEPDACKAQSFAPLRYYLVPRHVEF